MDFFQKDLSPRAKATLESLEPSAFFEELYKLYTQGAKKEEQSEELPQRLNASSASVESGGG